MKEQDIKRLLNAKDFDEFYNIYFELIPEGGIELKNIDSRLVNKEKQLIRDIPKEDSVYYGKDIYKKKD